jgi:hypothetical protein
MNDNLEVDTPPGWNAEMVQPITKGAYHGWTADLVDAETPWRHDPRKLAQSLMSLYADHQQHS